MTNNLKYNLLPNKKNINLFLLNLNKFVKKKIKQTYIC